MKNETTTKVDTGSNSKTHLILLILLPILAGFIVGIGIYFFLERQHQQEVDDLKTKIAVLEAKTLLDSEDTVDDKDKDEDDQIADSVIESIDPFWNQYTNNEYGFTMKIPKETVVSYGKCESVTGEESLFTFEEDLVPVDVYEGVGDIYIGNMRYAEVGEGVEENGVTSYKSCEVITNTYDTHEVDYANLGKGMRYQTAIKLDVLGVSNDAELEKFIQTKYGSACKVGEKTETLEEGLYDVAVEGDGLPMETSECVMNFIYVMKYSPEKELLVSWDIGQATVFNNPAADQIYFDEAMADSFMIVD